MIPIKPKNNKIPVYILEQDGARQFIFHGKTHNHPQANKWGITSYYSAIVDGEKQAIIDLKEMLSKYEWTEYFTKKDKEVIYI